MNQLLEGQLDFLNKITRQINEAIKKGNNLLEAVYRLRLMRFNNDISQNGLIEIKKLLQNTSYSTLIDYLFDKEGSQYIDFINSQNYENDIDLIFDNRKDQEYLISCIISTYNEGPNLISCVERLLDQTAYVEGKLEIIIMDSNSPTSEYNYFKNSNLKFDHVAYYRSKFTEKLSRAWNRGVYYSKGEQLTFTAPSQYFSKEAFSKMSSYFESDVVMVQGDVGNIVNNLTNNISDFERITHRKKDSFNQVNPILFMNYLAFDCAMISRSVFYEVGGFDENFTAAAENKLQLAVLSKGKLIQTGELLGGTKVSEDVGERLTVHPKIELEHFVATSIFESYEYMQKCALFDEDLNSKDRFQIAFDLLKNILLHEICYKENNKFYKYSNFRLGILSLTKLIDDNVNFENYRADLLILRLRYNIDLLIYNFKAQDSAFGKIYILMSVRFFLQFYKIRILNHCIYNQAIPSSRFKLINKVIYKTSLLFINHKRLNTDMYGNYIW